MKIKNRSTKLLVLRHLADDPKGTSLSYCIAGPRLVGQPHGIDRTLRYAQAS